MNAIETVGLKPRIIARGLTKRFQSARGDSVVRDLGASIGADTQHLIDMALMGSAMARILFDLDRPPHRRTRHHARIVRFEIGETPGGRLKGVREAPKETEQVDIGN